MLSPCIPLLGISDQRWSTAKATCASRYIIYDIIYRDEHLALAVLHHLEIPRVGCKVSLTKKTADLLKQTQIFLLRLPLDLICSGTIYTQTYMVTKCSLVLAFVLQVSILPICV